MVNKIKIHYYKYIPGEFLPIYVDGELSNRRDFHLYRFKKALTPVVSKLLHTI